MWFDPLPPHYDCYATDTRAKPPACPHSRAAAATHTLAFFSLPARPQPGRPRTPTRTSTGTPRESLAVRIPRAGIVTTTSIAALRSAPRADAADTAPTYDVLRGHCRPLESGQPGLRPGPAATGTT